MLGPGPLCEDGRGEDCEVVLCLSDFVVNNSAHSKMPKQCDGSDHWKCERQLPRIEWRGSKNGSTKQQEGDGRKSNSAGSPTQIEGDETEEGANDPQYTIAENLIPK